MVVTWWIVAFLCSVYSQDLMSSHIPQTLQKNNKLHETTCLLKNMFLHIQVRTHFVLECIVSSDNIDRSKLLDVTYGLTPYKTCSYVEECILRCRDV